MLFSIMTVTVMEEECKFIDDTELTTYARSLNKKDFSQQYGEILTQYYTNKNTTISLVNSCECCGVGCWKCLDDILFHLVDVTIFALTLGKNNFIDNVVDVFDKIFYSDYIERSPNKHKKTMIAFQKILKTVENSLNCSEPSCKHCLWMGLTYDKLKRQYKIYFEDYGKMVKSRSPDLTY